MTASEKLPEAVLVRRAEIVRSALASSALEGGTHSVDFEQRVERYLAGEIPACELSPPESP